MSLSLAGAALRWPGRRVWQAVGTVLCVLALHAGVGSLVADRMADFNLAANMPARIEVAYVRDMELQAPPTVPARPAAPLPFAAPAAVPAKAAASAPVTVVAAAIAPVEEPAVEAELPPVVQAELPAPVIAAAEPESPPPMEVVALDSGSGTRFVWPGSTRLSYVLTGNFRGEINGNAQVEWVRVGSRYQVHLDVLVGLPIAPLITRRMSSEGDITADGLAPQRYDEDTKIMFRDRRRLTMRFEPDAIVMANGQRQQTLPGVQDPASQFVQLSYLFSVKPELLVVGGAVEVPLALARKVDRWTYDVAAQEALSTPFGAVDTFHLKPRRAMPSAASNELTAEMWIAPSLQYLPARIRIRQDADTYIDLLIERKPQLAAPS